MSDPAIERLNYFNGQRLEAADLSLEQCYQINVRRWLNRSLFTPGIAAGLEVSTTPDKRTVLVNPGLALDALGREIIFVEQGQLAVSGTPSNVGDPVIGNYLVVQYNEQKVAAVQDGCAVQLMGSCKAAEDLSWGAPSRILAEPKLSWMKDWPLLDPNNPGAFKIVLAQAELDNTCAVRNIRSFVRKYVAAALPSRVSAISIEGEKDIDNSNPKELVFHIDTGVPDRFSLFLRARKFSTLHYTEMGGHDHTMNFKSLAGGDKAHTHPFSEVPNIPTSLDAVNPLTVSSNVSRSGSTGKAIVLNDSPDANDFEMDPPGGPTNVRVTGGKHNHSVSIPKGTTLPNIPTTHTHVINGTTDAAGAEISIRGKPAYTYVNSVQIQFDGQDITNSVLAQLQATAGAAAWGALGDGTSTHALVTEGTPEIDLLRLGLDVTPGKPHSLLFTPASPSGGTLQYNLYIE